MACCYKDKVHSSCSTTGKKDQYSNGKVLPARKPSLWTCPGEYFYLWLLWWFTGIVIWMLPALMSWSQLHVSWWRRAPGGPNIWWRIKCNYRTQLTGNSHDFQLPWDIHITASKSKYLGFWCIQIFQRNTYTCLKKEKRFCWEPFFQTSNIFQNTSYLLTFIVSYKVCFWLPELKGVGMILMGGNAKFQWVLIC